MKPEVFSVLRLITSSNRMDSSMDELFIRDHQEVNNKLPYPFSKQGFRPDAAVRHYCKYLNT
jgi:hypothetical protein